jgi:hypothetical protein
MCYFYHPAGKYYEYCLGKPSLAINEKGLFLPLSITHCHTHRIHASAKGGRAVKRYRKPELCGQTHKFEVCFIPVLVRCIMWASFLRELEHMQDHQERLLKRGVTKDRL